MNTTLVLVGIACIVGAIVGGGVKLVQVELRAVDSVWRQLLLGGFGLILVLAGTLGDNLPGARAGPAKAVEPRREPAPREPGPAAGRDAPAVILPEPAVNTVPRPNRRPEPTASAAPLPGKVDVFWCSTPDGGATAGMIAEMIRPAGPSVRVKPLRDAVNARPEYQIDRDIVRYDPGEAPAARAIARLATDAAGRTFAAEPALPGTPSVDYLSVFVCAPGTASGGGRL